MAPRKTKAKNAFQPESFSLGVNFKVKDMGMMPMNGDGEETEEVITIAGYANFSGNCDVAESCFIDRTNDVVVPTGIELTNYRKSPVILFQHNREYVIGKSITVDQKKDGLYVEAEIHSGAMEEEDFYAIKNGLYTSFSIGFRTKKAEWRQVGETEVFFITKSELLEISVVSIPCNTNSTFSVVKSFDGNIYAGDFDFNPKSAPTVDEPHKKDKEVNNVTTTIKVKLKEMISAEAVKEFEDLGLGESLDELKDVDAKTYIDDLVAKSVADAVAAATEALKAELTKAAEPPAEEKSEEEKPASDEKSDAEGEVKEDQEDVKESFKSLSDSIAELKALATAE